MPRVRPRPSPAAARPWGMSRGMDRDREPRSIAPLGRRQHPGRGGPRPELVEGRVAAQASLMFDLGPWRDATSGIPAANPDGSLPAAERRGEEVPTGSVPAEDTESQRVPAQREDRCPQQESLEQYLRSPDGLRRCCLRGLRREGGETEASRSRDVATCRRRGLSPLRTRSRSASRRSERIAARSRSPWSSTYGVRKTCVHQGPNAAAFAGLTASR